MESDPFLRDVKSYGTADTVIRIESSTKKNSLRTYPKGDMILETRNRQVVLIQSEYGEGSSTTGSGVLIHELRHSLPRMAMFDWVLTAAHTCSHWDDGMQSALKATVYMFGTDETSCIIENHGKPPSPEDLFRAAESRQSINQPNLSFEISSDNIFLFPGWHNLPSPLAGNDIALIKLPSPVPVYGRGFQRLSKWGYKQNPWMFTVIGFQGPVQISSKENF